MAISRSLNAIIKKIEEDALEVRDVFLGLVATQLTSTSPVDTSAYVLSHTIATASNKARGYTSRGKPGGQPKEAARATARGLLESDIASLPREDAKIYINNRSPHSQAVENGGGGWISPGYFVYKNTKIKASVFLAEAVATVKGG